MANAFHNQVASPAFFLRGDDIDRLRVHLLLAVTGGWPAPIASYTPVTLLPYNVLSSAEKVAFICAATVSPLTFGIEQCEGLYSRNLNDFFVPTIEETFVITSEISPILCWSPNMDDSFDYLGALQHSTTVGTVDSLVSLLQQAGGHCALILSGKLPVDELNVAALQLYHRMGWLRSLVINLATISITEFVALLGSDLQNLVTIAAIDPLPSVLHAYDIGSHKGTQAHADVLRNIIRNVDTTFLSRLSLRLWKQLKSPRRDLFGQAVPFIVLAGEVQTSTEDGMVKALSGFPSIRLTTHAFAKQTGRYFYEVEIMTEGLMQIGFADGSFRCDPASGQGVGDHLHSWAFDGMRTKKWNVACDSYGKRWRVGDIVGALIDMDLMEIRYFLNGEDLGQAFVSFPSSQPIFPALSLNVRQTARVNIGQCRFMCVKLHNCDLHLYYLQVSSRREGWVPLQARVPGFQRDG